jgi:hypothetical protein
MIYETFDAWFRAVQQFTPVPALPDDRWYDAYLDCLDPQEAARSVQPVQVRECLHPLWVAIKNLFIRAHPALRQLCREELCA